MHHNPKIPNQEVMKVFNLQIIHPFTSCLLLIANYCRFSMIGKDLFTYFKLSSKSPVIVSGREYRMWCSNPSISLLSKVIL